MKAKCKSVRKRQRGGLVLSIHYAFGKQGRGAKADCFRKRGIAPKLRLSQVYIAAQGDVKVLTDSKAVQNFIVTVALIINMVYNKNRTNSRSDTANWFDFSAYYLIVTSGLI